MSNKELILREIINDFSRYIVDKYTKDFKKEKIIEILDTDSDTDSDPNTPLEDISYKAIININLKKMSREIVSNNNIDFLTDRIKNKIKVEKKNNAELIKRIYSRLKQVSKKILRIKKEFETSPNSTISSIKEKITKQVFDIIYDTGIESQVLIAVGEKLPVDMISIQIFLVIIVSIILYYFYKNFINKINRPRLRIQII